MPGHACELSTMAACLLLSFLRLIFAICLHLLLFTTFLLLGLESLAHFEGAPEGLHCRGRLDGHEHLSLRGFASLARNPTLLHDLNRDTQNMHESLSALHTATMQTVGNGDVFLYSSCAIIIIHTEL